MIVSFIAVNDINSKHSKGYDQFSRIHSQFQGVSTTLENIF